jgi:hypothetical protein
MSGKAPFGIRNQRGGNTPAAPRRRHEKLVELVMPDGAEAEHRTGLPDNARIGKHGRQAIGKTLLRAQAGKRRRKH